MCKIKGLKKVCFITATFAVVDIAAITLLVSHGTDFHYQFAHGFYKYSFSNSFFDLWALGILRAAILLGAVFGVLCNRKAISNIKLVNSFISTKTGLVWMFTFVKLLAYSDEVIDLKKPWFWGLFSWTLVASLVMYVLWTSLASIEVNNYLNINASDEERQGLLSNDQGNMEEKNKQKDASSVLQLIKLSRHDWPWLLAGFTFLTIAAAGQIFIPYFTGQVIDGIAIEKSKKMFTEAIIYMSLISLASSISSGLRGAIFKFVNKGRLNIRIRQMLFASIVKQEIGFFDKHHTGDITSRLTSDTTTMSDTLGLNLNIFLRSLIQAVGTCVFMIKLSWQLTMVTFIGLPIILWVSKVYGNYYKKLAKQIQDSLAVVNNVAEETCSTMKTVRSFANELHESKRYGEKLKHTYGLWVKEAIAYGAYMWCSQIFELALTVATLYYGGILVIKGSITGGHLVSFILYQLELGYCLESIGGVYTGLMQAVGASEKVFEYINRKPALPNEGKHAPEKLDGRLEFKNVCFSYPTRPDSTVLNNVSFAVNPGEVVALVGPSGGGKSSCVNLLEHFYEVQSGEVLLDDRPINDYNHKYLHRKIALVGQEPVLYARTVRENIAYGVDDCDLAQVQHAADLANAHRFIMEMKEQYETQTGEKGLQLSGGQKQRIAIARALVRNPRVLLLDEATSALDAESEHVVQQALYKNLQNHTVLIIAHRLSTVERANKIIVIDKGRVVEQGTHKTLLAKDGLYTKLVQRQLLGFEDIENNHKSILSSPSIQVTKNDSSDSEVETPVGSLKHRV